MKTVWILYSYVNYEGRDNLRAFSSEAQACQVKELCEAHLSLEPESPDSTSLTDEEFDRQYTKWQMARNRWLKKAPIQGCDYVHGFGVEGLLLDETNP